MPPGQEGHVWLLGDFLGGEADATASVLPLQRPGLPVPLQAPLLSQVLFHRESEPVPGSHDALLHHFLISHVPSKLKIFRGLNKRFSLLRSGLGNSLFCFVLFVIEQLKNSLCTGSDPNNFCQ